MKKNHVGIRGAWVPSKAGQPKHHVAFGPLPLGCNPSARWRFDLGTHMHGPRLALGLAG